LACAKERGERFGDDSLPCFVEVRLVGVVDVLTGRDARAQRVGRVDERDGRSLAELPHQVILREPVAAHRVEFEIATIGIALLGSSSGRFKSSVEAIKAEAITERAAARGGLSVVRVTAVSLKKILGCAAGQKWRARAEERFNPTGHRRHWSPGAAGAAAAALKVAAGRVESSETKSRSTAQAVGKRTWTR
jgi:hypothetical protein